MSQDKFDASESTRDIKIGPLHLLPEEGIYWSSSGTSNYSYSVCRKEQAESGSRLYGTDQDYSPYMGMTMEISLSDNWEIVFAERSPGREKRDGFITSPAIIHS